MLRDYLAK